MPTTNLPESLASFVLPPPPGEYRIWFTSYIFWCSADGRTGPPWWDLLCGAAANDLWLWEDEDEEVIKKLVEDLDSHRDRDNHHWVPLKEWDDACRALSARLSRKTAPASSRPLAHLTPPIRLRFIAWLLLAGPLERTRILLDAGFPGIGSLIYDWANALQYLGPAATICKVCRISHALPIWIATMLEVYSLEDVRSIPWYYECNCLDSELTAIACSERRTIPETFLGKGSPAFRVLYEVVVPLWPLLHWVAFRTTANDQTDPLPEFLHAIRGQDQDLFAWDDDDDSELRLLIAKNTNGLELYPQDWNKYMVEIPLETWVQIGNITRTVDRQRRGSDDTLIRLAAISLKYSTPIAFQNIFSPLNVWFEKSPFAIMARAVDKRCKIHLITTDFESEEFWVSQNLENWLSTREAKRCQWICHYSLDSSICELVQVMNFVLHTTHQNLATYACSRILQRPRGPDRNRALDELVKFEDIGLSGKSLTHPPSHVKFLLGLVKQSVENDSSTSHTISTDVHEHINRDISDIVVRLVLFLRKPQSYKDFLAYRETDAQRLLDVLQDLLDLVSFSIVRPTIFEALVRLSRASGLHPRCFALSGLQKVGQQVTGGGFGDIWKGLVRGQGVSVKIMRIFEDSDIKAVLKEFGREAVIWRQLCHPNVLPFFGVYHLESRLCLVSPWMENGNVMKYLAHQNPSTDDRLSLILDVALGLEYLHREKVIHGDLKGLSILVTPSHRACIADFGVSSIAKAMTARFTHSTVTAQAGTARYQAPELFEVENPAQIHFGSDVYAFGCVCYEILTGKVPFPELQNDMAVMMRVAQGHRPSRPLSCLGTTTLDSVWKLMQECWEGKSEIRPSASQLVERLVSPSIGAKSMSSTIDWDDKFTSKFRRSLQPESLLPSVIQIERILFGDEVVEGKTFTTRRDWSFLSRI
ncbi:Protein kinase domain-containing protein [Mycena venus]|uniref:Protein kinase domain-containing protein n=1 Tax=Mycena venus TaxID=2733690 RepID=A0A8H6Z2E8_9AGAR|nr:Protein kinase domain-containing protein [Mycena venus]